MSGILDKKEGAITLDDLEKTQEVAQETETQETETQEEVQAQAETQTEETSTEAQTQETSQETAPEGETQTETQTETTPEFSLDVLNKHLGTNFESEDQFRSILNKPTKEEEYEVLSKEHEDLNQKYELLLKQADPSTYFSSDDAMRLEAFKKENPKKDASVAQRIFAAEDLESVDDMSIVKMGYKFDTPGLRVSDKDLEAMIAEDLNVDPDTPMSEWPPTAQGRLAVQASKYRSQFDDVKQNVQIPERISIDDLMTQRQKDAEERKRVLTDSWTQNATDVLGKTKKISVPVGVPKEGEQQEFFDWELDGEPQQEVEAIRDDFIDRGIDVNEDGKEMFNKAIELALLDRNLPLIMKKYGEHLLATQEEKHLEETNNTSPITDQQRPDKGSEEKIKEERKNFALEGLNPSVTGRSLFNFKRE